MAIRNDQPKTILDLGMNECGWPVKEDKRGVATHFCAKPAVAGTRWCKEHIVRMTSSKKGLDAILAKVAMAAVKRR